MNKEQTRKFIELLQKYDSGIFPEEYEGEYLCYREDAIISAFEVFTGESDDEKNGKRLKCKCPFCPATLDFEYLNRLLKEAGYNEDDIAKINTATWAAMEFDD